MWKRYFCGLLCAAFGFALLTGCGNPEMVPQRAPFETPEVYASADLSKTDLLYISGGWYYNVNVFTYPDGKWVQTLDDFTQPVGMCTDQKGDVYITDPGKHRIDEYAHGGAKPIKTLDDKSGFGINCAVDPTTGNLAVINSYDLGSHFGGVLIYTHAEGKGKQLIDHSIFFYGFVSYDPAGNLFVDGENFFDSPRFAEMPHGSRRFVNLSLNHTFYWPGAVQWHGDELTIGDQIPEAPSIERFKLSGSTGTLVGTVVLDQGHILNLWQYYIDGKTVIGGADPSKDEYFWKYPKGGLPYKNIHGNKILDPQGVAISKAER